MAVYSHTLTGIEAACGVTLDAVARELPRGVHRGDTFVVADDAGPALAASVARCAFAGADVEYLGRSVLGRVYRRVAS